MSGTIWVLLDARANYDEDEATVFMTGTREECEEAQREGDYGDDCVVAEWPLDASAAGGGR